MRSKASKYFLREGAQSSSLEEEIEDHLKKDGIGNKRIKISKKKRIKRWLKPQ